MAQDFLKGLPSFDKENFTRFHSEGQSKSVSKKPEVYLRVQESDSTSQVIVTDKTNILLRYLRQQLEVKNVHQKRNLSTTDNSSPSRKIPRIETSTTTNETTEDD